MTVSCYSGARTLEAGDSLRFDFRLMITPFKPLDTAGQWGTRYFHAFVPVDSAAKRGANTINVHHATRINPWINYPFLEPAQMRAYIDSAHARGMKVKIYYTVRELSDHAPELFALRSLGDEVLQHGPGGGFSWLQEHLGSDYLAAWHVPEIRDAAVVNSGVSRWHNFYVEGLDWLVKHEKIDGLYIDDVAFDRTTMKRVRKVLDRGNPGALIDLHSANQYNPRDGFASSANLYLEHFPFLNRLWFGEYFDYDKPSDYWLVEISGIPFGLMGEMLEKGGNPWRGMTMGMTARLPWSGDPSPLWKAWDTFGIKRSRMHGWWSESPPVTTGDSLVLATTWTRPGRAMIALGSWHDEDRAVKPDDRLEGAGYRSRPRPPPRPRHRQVPGRRFVVSRPVDHRPGEEGPPADRRESIEVQLQEGRERREAHRAPLVFSSSRLLVFCLLRPRRLDPVHPRIRDQLPEVLVQVAAHDERGLDDRAVAAEEFLRPGDLRLVESKDRLLRVGKALREVLHHVGLGAHRLELRHLALCALDHRGRRRAVGHRREEVVLAGDVHEGFADRAHPGCRAPAVLVGGDRLGQGEELVLQRVEVAHEARPYLDRRSGRENILRLCGCAVGGDAGEPGE